MVGGRKSTWPVASALAVVLVLAASCVCDGDKADVGRQTQPNTVTATKEGVYINGLKHTLYTISYSPVFIGGDGEVGPVS